MTARLDDPLERAVTRAAHQREIKEAVTATIERCAQVAEQQYEHTVLERVGQTQKLIAAAIRALKRQAMTTPVQAQISGKRLSTWDREVLEDEVKEATIECCAQIADKYARLDIRSNPAADIAAEIRALT